MRLPRLTVIAILWVTVLPGAAVGSTPDKSVPDKEAPTVIQDLTYAERGDRKLAADVYMPPGPGPFPGVLMVHGGAWSWGGKWQMSSHAAAVADEGYTVVAMSHRLAPRDKFPAQTEDCREAIRWMKRNAAKYKIDPARIAGYGYSSGGHLVCLLGLAAAPPRETGGQSPPADPEARIQAVVAGGAPCDFEWLAEDSRMVQHFLGGTRREIPQVYREASPVYAVTEDDPPVFLFHGQNDWLVPVSSPTRLFEQLKAEHVRAEMYVAPGKGHIGTFFDVESRQQAIKFLNHVLKPGR